MNNLLKSVVLGVLIAPLYVSGVSAQTAMTGEQINAAASGKAYDFTGQLNGVMDFGADGTASLTLRIGTK